MIVVYGDPAPQGSKSGGAVRNGPRCPACGLRRIVWRRRCPACKGGEPVIAMHESSKAVGPWRKAVTAAARLAAENWGTPGGPGWVVLDGPVMASVVFTFERPAGHWGTGRNAGRLKPSAPGRPERYPDLSKLLRSTEDALTGVAWSDDARVVEYGRLAKVYAGEDGHALASPGAVIWVRPWQDGDRPAALAHLF